MKRKILTYFLCLSMVVTSVPSLGLTVYAEDVHAETGITEDVHAETGITEDAVTETDTTVDGTAVTDEETDEGTAVAGSDTVAGTTAEESDEAAGMPEANAAEDAAAGNDVIAAAADSISEKWYAKVEAEEGTPHGDAKVEVPTNMPGVTFISNLDQGKDKASVTIKVTTEFTDKVEMKVTYRSGDSRDLCFDVNGGEKQKWSALNSGSWTQTAETDGKEIQLTAGENSITFYAEDGQPGPGLDYITFSRNGGTAEDMKPQEGDLTVAFRVNDQVVKILTEDEVADGVISEEELPTADQMTGAPEGKDFLGWFWGPGDKYEGAFPMAIKDAQDYNGIEEGNKLYLDARYGKHVDGYSVEKVENEFGQRLIFEDNFDSDSLNLNKWVDKYLSSWSDSWQNTKSYEFHPDDTANNGSISLMINGPEDENPTLPWCVEFDQQTVISGFTTGDRNGLHNWNRSNKVRNPHDTELTHINQYGYYEMRMKGQLGAARHSAWWLLGFEDVPEESAEVDIFEVQGQYKGKKNQVALHEWNDPDAFGKDAGGNSTYTTQNDLCNEWHVYGFNWVEGGGDESHPDRMDFYIDGQMYYSKNVNIDYPMIQLFSQYEKRKDAGAWTGAWDWQPYPNSMEIDYVRVYKDVPEEYRSVTNPEITEVKAENVEIAQKDIALKTYTGEGGGTDGGDYTEKNLPGTKSYVRVEWSDGVQTQEPVEWDPVTEDEIAKLKAGESVVKEGTVTITSEPEKAPYPYGKKVTMTVSPIPDPPAPPWNSEGMTVNNDLGLLFDGKINETGATSMEFVASTEDMEAGNVSITYDFQKDVLLSGIDLWTNFGAKQGIKAFEVAVWDEEKESWDTVKGEDDQTRLFEAEWKTEDEPAEEYAVQFPKVSTSKVKIIIKDAGLQWNKVAMREIEFHTEEVALESIEVTTGPTKTEYKEGEALDTTGMVITGTFNNGKSAEIPLTDVEISGYDPAKIGTQTVKVTYQGLESTFEVVVNKGVSVINKIPTIIGAKDVVLTVGDKFDPLKGITAKDDEDGDLTKKIEVKSNVDTAKTGKYEVVYTVKDSKGATATKTIKVTVKAKAAKPGAGNNNHQNDNNQNNNGKKDETVQTGDSLNIGFWVLLMMASAAAVSLFFRRKNKQ